MPAMLAGLPTRLWAALKLYLLLENTLAMRLDLISKILNHIREFNIFSGNKKSPKIYVFPGI